MHKQVELRKLQAASLCTIATILETNGDWKKVMSCIPKDPQSQHFEPKYNHEHIRLIEEFSKSTGRGCAEILFDEWGTSGRVRPTLSTLKDVVLKAQIYRAADEIASILGEDPPERPQNGPAAAIDTNISKLLEEQSMEQRFNDLDPIKKNQAVNQTTSNNYFNNKTTVQMKSEMSEQNNNSSIDISSMSISVPLKLATPGNGLPEVSKAEQPQNLHYQTYFPDNIQISSDFSTEQSNLEDDTLEHFKYEVLERITNKFSQTLTSDGDILMGKIGSGGFGEVFVGNHSQHGTVAIKRANSNLDQEIMNQTIKTLNSEIKYLSQFRHENIIQILGFSCDGPTMCIVCEYIDGGSLLEKLKERVLTKAQRTGIMLGIAEGLKYLHSNEKPIESNNSIDSTTDNSSRKNFVHGDVKSANILLTKEFIPKLCDFGLSVQYENTHISFSKVFGTDAYLAPESLSGTITQKADIFSYGIVLLELLTGLPANIKVGGERLHIKDYIEETCPDGNITPLVDPVIGEWNIANDVYRLAKSCMAYDRKNRPDIGSICDSIKKWC